MESGRVSGLASRQDGTQFEDALRRLHALEKKLTDQVQVDIRELRSKWILPRVERVTTNTFKLYQVREQLKRSKVLYLEEERILEEFNKVKQGLKTSSMDDDTFEATRETCMVLGGKLMDIRSKQLRCYSDNEDLETDINKEIMTLRFEDKDFEDLDINQVRASTPLRQMSPTPLDRHRSREPSPFIMPKLRLGSGTITPGGSKPSDPHTYLSRSGSSQSLYGGGGPAIGGSQMNLDTFRAAMEAKQAEDESLPQSSKQSSNHPPSLSQSMSNMNLKVGGSYTSKTGASDLLTPGSMFCDERPSSAMSEMSINIHDGDYMSRAESRMEHFGDDVSDGALYLGHGHDDFAKDSFHTENSDDKNLPLHLPQDHKEVKSKPNEDVGIKEENISRKIEITAVTNKPKIMAKSSEMKEDSKEDSITPIEQPNPQNKIQKEETLDTKDKNKTGNQLKKDEKPGSVSKPFKTSSLSQEKSQIDEAQERGVNIKIESHEKKEKTSSSKMSTAKPDTSTPKDMKKELQNDLSESNSKKVKTKSEGESSSSKSLEKTEINTNTLKKNNKKVEKVKEDVTETIGDNKITKSHQNEEDSSTRKQIEKSDPDTKSPKKDLSDSMKLEKEVGENFETKACKEEKETPSSRPKDRHNSVENSVKEGAIDSKKSQKDTEEKGKNTKTKSFKKEEKVLPNKEQENPGLSSKPLKKNANDLENTKKDVSEEVRGNAKIKSNKDAAESLSKELNDPKVTSLRKDVTETKELKKDIDEIKGDKIYKNKEESSSSKLIDKDDHHVTSQKKDITNLEKDHKDVAGDTKEKIKTTNNKTEKSLAGKPNASDPSPKSLQKDINDLEKELQLEQKSSSLSESQVEGKSYKNNQTCKHPESFESFEKASLDTEKNSSVTNTKDKPKTLIKDSEELGKENKDSQETKAESIKEIKQQKVQESTPKEKLEEDRKSLDPAINSKVKREESGESIKPIDELIVDKKLREKDIKYSKTSLEEKKPTGSPNSLEENQKIDTFLHETSSQTKYGEEDEIIGSNIKTSVPTQKDEAEENNEVRSLNVPQQSKSKQNTEKSYQEEHLVQSVLESKNKDFDIEKHPTEQVSATNLKIKEVGEKDSKEGTITAHEKKEENNAVQKKIRTSKTNALEQKEKENITESISSKSNKSKSSVTEDKNQLKGKDSEPSCMKENVKTDANDIVDENSKSTRNKEPEAELHQSENQRHEEITSQKKNTEKSESSQFEKVPFTATETSLNETEDLEYSQKQIKSACNAGKAQGMLEREKINTTKLESVICVQDEEGNVEFQEYNESQPMESDKNKILKGVETVKEGGALEKAEYSAGKENKPIVRQEPSKEANIGNIPSASESIHIEALDPNVRSLDTERPVDDDEIKYTSERSNQSELVTNIANAYSDETNFENVNQEFSNDTNQLGQYQNEKRTSRPTSCQENNAKVINEDKEEINNRPDSRGSMSGFTQTEPAEWYQQDDNEDELMIILDTEHMIPEEEEPELNQLNLLNSRPESRERSSSRNSQGSQGNFQTNDNIPSTSEFQEIPDSISKNIQTLRKMDMEIEMDHQTEEDVKALKELEIQYELENGKDSRNSFSDRTSSLSYTSNKNAEIQIASPVDKIKDEKINTEEVNQVECIDLKEPKNSRPGSRSSLKSSNKRSLFSDKKKISFDDDIEVKNISESKQIGDNSQEVGFEKAEFQQSEPAEWYPSEENDENEDELFIVFDRAQSNERASSRTSETSNSSFKAQQETDRKKSSSMVPELEIVEMPNELRKRFEGMESDIDYLKDSQDNFAKIRYDGQERADSPRPPSQNRPSSTGFSHLDEFERKLAAMESELASEEEKRQELEKSELDERPLSRGENMWDLSANIERETEFENVPLDFKENQTESKFGSVRAYNVDRQNLTDDGFFINQEEELQNVDHSMIKGGEFTNESEGVGSGYVSPGQSKKVSFAATEERYEIERPGEVNTLGKKLYSFSPPKPMKKLPGRETKVEETSDSNQEFQGIDVPILVTKKPQSPVVLDKHAKESGKEKSESMFGSLLRKGRIGSRSGSRQSSVERGSQDLGSEDEGRSSRGISDIGSDAESENSLVTKFKKLTKKKPKHVQMADFDELFARGEARSALLESENDKDPFLPKSGSQDAQTTFAPFEAYSKDTKFETSKRQESIGYAEKVMSFLDEQENTPQITKDIMSENETSFNDVKVCTREKMADKSQKKDHKKDNETNASPNETNQTNQQLEEAPISRSKSSSMKNLLSSLTGGRMGSKSPDPSRRNSGSLFGSLLRKGGKGSKTGSRSGSRQSSVERGSQYLGSEDEGRSTSRVSDIGSDGGSESSMVMKLKKLTKKKPPKVKTTDFDELFARGMAKSAQLDRETKDILITEKKNENILKMPQKKTEDSIRKNQPTSQEEEFLARVTDFVAKYDFDSENKVWPAVEANRSKHEKNSTNTEVMKSPIISESDPSPSIKIEENKTTKYAAPQEIKLSPVSTKKDIFTGKELPTSPEEEFLSKITNFVAKYQVDSDNSEKVWPAVVSQDSQPKETNSTSRNLPEVKENKSSMEMFKKFVEEPKIAESRNRRSKSKSLVEPTPRERRSKSKTQVESTPEPMHSTHVSHATTSLPKTIDEAKNKSVKKESDKIVKPISEADFLAKVTSFVAKYEPKDEYEEKIWPAIAPTKESSTTESKPSSTVKPSGKKYLDIETGTEWFGRSIEMKETEPEPVKVKSQKTPEKSPKSVNNLSAGAALMRKHLSGMEPNVEDTSKDKSKSSQADRELENKISPPNSSTQKISSSKEEVASLLAPEVPSRTKSKSPRKDASVEKSATPAAEPPQLAPVKIDQTLQPAPQSANAEFYTKLVTGLRNLTTPEPESVKETVEQDIYRKYSHHLGRAEFGSLRRKDSTQNSSSNLGYQSRDSVYNLPSRGLSRDPSFEKINKRLASSRDQIRSQSKVSDTSEALPDLELEDDLIPVRETGTPISRPRSSRGNSAVQKSGEAEASGRQSADIKEEITPSTDAINKKEEALKNVADTKQKIREVKEQIQNGLMTVVGVGVMAYLTTLENMGGQ